MLFSVAAFAAALAGAAAGEALQTPAHLNERLVRVPVGAGFSRVELETTVFTPTGDGPFPVVIVNHGKAPGNPVFQERARFLHASREFVRRGYAVVLPMRPGFAGSSGVYIQPGCNIASNGEVQAEWIIGVLEWLRTQPWADAERVVVVGQSHGGLTTLALGARNPPGVRGLVNFAGGLRVDNCIWENALAQAFAQYGARTRIPNL